MFSRLVKSTLTVTAVIAAALPLLAATSSGAAAKSCSELRSLCYTMRDNKTDCTKPYQRCLSTGTFITPLGRVFKATRWVAQNVKSLSASPLQILRGSTKG